MRTKILGLSLIFISFGCREDEPLDLYSGRYLVEYEHEWTYSNSPSYYAFQNDRIIEVTQKGDTLHFLNNRYLINWVGQSAFVEDVAPGKKPSLLSFTNNYETVHYYDYVPSSQPNIADTMVSFVGNRTTLFNANKHPKYDELVGNYLFSIYHYKYISGIDESWTAGGYVDIVSYHPSSGTIHYIEMFGESFLVKNFVTHLYDISYFPSSTTEERLVWEGDSIKYDYLFTNPFAPDSIMEIWTVTGHRVE